MRVIGLLLVVLAGAALSPHDADEDVLARFAYANPAAFVTSLELSAPPRQQALAPAVAESRVTDLRPLTVAAADPLADQPPEPAHVSSHETVLPSPAAEMLLLLPPSTERLAPLPDPVLVLAAIPQDEIDATEVRPPPRKKRITRPHVRTSLRRASVRRRPPATRQARHQSQRSQKRASRNKVAAATGKPPRWAARMFENVWQDHAFAYQ